MTLRLGFMGREQRYTSAKTARRQVPGAFRVIGKLGGWRAGTINLDIGGGPWDEGTLWLSAIGVRNLVFDPFNRSPEHNEDVKRIASGDRVDSVTLCNVLNVIAEDWARRDALTLALIMLAPDAPCWIDVYEGDSTGIGKPSRYGWQEHRKLRSYVREVREVFPNAELVRGQKVIRACNSR